MVGDAASSGLGGNARGGDDAGIIRSACPICACPVGRPLGQLGHRQLTACRDCGHEFVSAWSDELLAAEYRAAYYADDRDPRIDAWAASHRPVWDAIVAQLAGLHPAAASFLDVGAGSGGFLQQLRRRHPDARLAAVEAAAPARQALAVRMPDVAFVAERAEGLGQVDGRFDVVTMLQTLEHLADPAAAVRGAMHCLNPGGLLFVTVPNRRSLAVLRRGRRADCYANGTHLQFFSRGSLLRLLGIAGGQRARRVVRLGGGQHTALVPMLLQYCLRLVGASTELRVAARRG